MFKETISLNEKRNVTLTAYVQDVPGADGQNFKRPAVLIMPGGAYLFCCDAEADPVAMCYLQAGYHAFILRYSVGENAEWPNPLEDYENAMAYIESQEEAWKVRTDKIAVVGFSAGANLAGAAAATAEHHPAAAVLGYGVLSQNVRDYSQSAPVVCEEVDGKMCPCFLFATRTDSVVPVQNTLDMMNALNKYHISFEAHIYDYGPHGFSIADPALLPGNVPISQRAGNWVADSIGWLQDVLGECSGSDMTKPVCKAHVTDDEEEYLSVDCTVGCIMANAEAVWAIATTIQEMKEKIPPFAPDMTFEDMMHILANTKLRDLLLERNIAVDRMEKIDKQLSGVRNNKTV